ncbi:MAG: c-type cytochrome [Gammaproteobacteria bacterium]|nr:c-type cytochrome [Gammaproteobacteria bacterium]
MKSIIAFLLLLTLALQACDREKEIPGKEAEDKAAQQQQPVADAARGEQIARACFQCHPADGRIVKAEYPQIIGSQLNYLNKSLLDYLSGARKHEEMSQAVKQLDEQQILDVAAYYSSLTTSWISSVMTTSRKSTAPDPQDIAAGKELAGPCVSCHGQNGNSATEGVPSLAGLSGVYIATALDGYFTGSRNNEIMKVFKHAFGEDKIARLGAYFSAQQRMPPGLPVQGDARAGGNLATQRCIGCHGEGGNSLLEEFPSLAGQNYKFLYEATLSYTNGKRTNQIMQTALKGLSKTDIRNIAAYYATQKPVAAQPAPASDLNDPVQAAANAAKPCMGCHGKDGNSRIAGNPNLSGFNPAHLAAAINQYQTGARQHALMKSFVDGLNAQEAELISIYFASQEPKPTSNTGKGKAQNAKDIVGGCEACHGAKGVGTSKTPSLAGQDATYLVAAITAYKNKLRGNSEMQNAIAALSSQDFKNLAAYFAAQTPVKSEVTPLQTPQQLAEKCNRCHGLNQNKPEIAAPRIAGQSEAYLRKALNDYKTKARDNTTMFAMLDVLSNWEISRLAAYYARLNSGGK